MLITASDKTRLRLLVNRFMNALERLVVLGEDINKILCNKLVNTEKINDEVKENNKRI